MASRFLTELDTLGWIGYSALGLGHAMIALDLAPSAGWPLRLAGELVWCYIGARARLYSALWCGLVFAALDLWAALRALALI